MKKITKYLIIPLFSIFAFFLLFNTNVSAEMSGGVVVDPGNGSGDMSVNPPISGEELYEQCHTYITTNIISAESLTEALNGKIYGNFTQEDCMEMINIASKREVIKNLINLPNISRTERNLNYTIQNGVITLNGTANSEGNVILINNLGLELKANTTYSFKGFVENINDSVIGTTFYIGVSEWSNNVNDTIMIVLSNDVSRTITPSQDITLNWVRLYVSSGINFYDLKIKPMLEKGSTTTPYVSYDYHREYYEEGIDYADNRVNTESTSYIQGVSDADNRVNTDSVNYKTGVSSGYEKATKDGKSLGTFIPNLLGGFGSFFLTILNIDILGFNLLSIFGIAITIGIIILILKFMRG